MIFFVFLLAFPLASLGLKDRCEGLVCPQNATCKSLPNGCVFSCRPDHYVEDSACVPDPCVNFKCLENAKCYPYQGECRVKCDAPKVFFKGACIPDPCINDKPPRHGWLQPDPGNPQRCVYSCDAGYFAKDGRCHDQFPCQYKRFKPNPNMILTDKDGVCVEECESGYVLEAGKCKRDSCSVLSEGCPSHKGCVCVPKGDDPKVCLVGCPRGTRLATNAQGVFCEKV